MAMFNHTISVRQMLDMVQMAQRLNSGVFFYGGAGVGKSQKMQQIADILFPNNIGNNLVDIRFSDKEPTDLAGVQVPVDVVINGEAQVRTVYAVPDFWPTDPDWEGIIFLDELTNADEASQHVGYQAMEDRKIGSIKFPKGAIVVGAGNREGDGGAVNNLLLPLANRMIICELRYDLDVWIEDYAIPNDVNPTMIGFLKNHPDKFYTGDQIDESSGTSYCTPRSNVKGGKILTEFQTGVINEVIASIGLQGVLGNGMDSEVLAYNQRTKSLPTLSEVLDGSLKDHSIARSEVDLLYVLSQSALSQLRKEALDDVYTDDELVERVGNFLTFMFHNYAAEQMDIITAVTINLFKKATVYPAVLEANHKRGKLKPKLLASSDTLVDILDTYQERYGDLMSESE